MPEQEQHTPGPWHYEADDGSKDGMPGGSIVAENGRIIASAQSFVNNDQGQLEADLRRITACVNACEGLHTAALEEAGLGYITSELSHLRRQQAVRGQEVPS